MNRYFHFPEDANDDPFKRVIVFHKGRSPGQSYWPDGNISYPLWTLRDMKGKPVTKEISRRTARKIVKNIP